MIRFKYKIRVSIMIRFKYGIRVAIMIRYKCYDTL